jgi:hypothetical protein
MARPTIARITLERDITDSFLRLRLARAERDRKEAEAHEERLNRLLEGMLRDAAPVEEMAS